jgi:hypothetical protein
MEKNQPAHLGLLRELFSHPDIEVLKAWLPQSTTKSDKYQHFLIQESADLRNSAIPLVARYVARAHGPAIRRLRNILGNPFDPRIAARRNAVLANYPKGSDDTTMQGFFGEIISGLLAELYLPGNKKWRIPAFCFHSHDLLFDELIRQGSGRTRKRVIGRFGDDSIAFSLNKDRTAISRILLSEAKLTTDHDSTLIAVAHTKLNDQPIESSTISLAQLVDALKLQDDSEITALWALWIQEFRDSERFAETNRFDAVTYAHGRRPKKKNTWICTNSPHEEYNTTRHLSVLEVHFTEPVDLARTIYDMAFP